MRSARKLRSPRIGKPLARTLAGLVCAGASLLGCDRKAPGPAECLAYAEAFVGISREDERINPDLESKIDAVTQLCLTTPYDRALIACAQSTQRARDCFDAYKRRIRQAQ
jgi:hypothetical protein